MENITYQLRPYQKEAEEKVLNEWNSGVQKTLLVLPTGCHAKGEKLILSDGKLEEVQRIKRGDRLLGEDGSQRIVLAVQKGTSSLFKIIPENKNFEPFIVTKNHKLTLKKGKKIEDVTVEEWLSWSDFKKRGWTLFKSQKVSEFHGKKTELTINPYLAGLFVSNHSTSENIRVTTTNDSVINFVKTCAAEYNCSITVKPSITGKRIVISDNTDVLKKEMKRFPVFRKEIENRIIPYEFKTAPLDWRVSFLAGLIDGYRDFSGWRVGGIYLKISEEKIRNDVVFIGRSIGLGVRMEENGEVKIFGDTGILPILTAKPSENVKKALISSFKIEPAGSGDYYGFTVDQDNRYLLSDFTVTHNCGKTVVFSNIAKDRTENGSKTLILAHRGELLTQAADKIKSICGVECSVEKAEQTSIDKDSPITVASVQTMARENRLNKFSEDRFETIIVDEAHHSAADTYQKVLKHFPNAKVLGVTATPDRADKKKLSNIFDSVAYEYSMLEAVQDGYLSPIKALMAPIKIDISKVGMQNGDYKAGEVGATLDKYLVKIADEMTKYCKDRKTVVFLPLVSTSLKFAEILNKKGFHAAEVDGDSKDRDAILKDFNDGKYNVLCNAMLLTEGWDCPSVDCIVVLRPTRSDSLYRQMVGRGMRLSPGKKDLLLLDFLWLTEERKLVRDPASLICQDEDELKRTQKKIKDGCTDILEAKDEADKDIVAEREAKLAERIAAMKKRKKKLVDPLQYGISINSEEIINYQPVFAWEKEKATEAQKQALEKSGIYSDGIKTKGEAKILLDVLNKRRLLRLATPKQIRFLESKGFKRVGTWKFADASSMIDLIATMNWTVPKFINPGAFIPTGAAMAQVYAVTKKVKEKQKKN